MARAIQSGERRFVEALTWTQMRSEIQKSKEALRQKIRSVIKSLSAERRQSDSKQFCSSLREQQFFQSASSILFFAPLPEELDLCPALETALADGKVVALPCFDGSKQCYAPRQVTNLRVELVTGQFGIREPAAHCLEIPLADLDLVLVPGIAFDLRGFRLGRGRGFYDQWLASFTGKKIGVAFDEQVVDAIPLEDHDVRMHFVATPTRCVKCEI